MKKVTGLFLATVLISIQIPAQPPQDERPPKPPTTEEKLKHVSEKINKELVLSAAQKAKVEAAYKDFFMEMDKLRKNSKPDQPPPPPPLPGKKDDVEKLSKARDAKIKSALTDVQYKKYTEIENSLRPPRPGGPPPASKKP